MRTPLAFFLATFLTTSVLAQTQPHDNQTVNVGPWSIATSYKAEKFDNCSMSRSVDGLGISFVRTPDGLLLLLDSPGSLNGARPILSASLQVRSQ